jgi:transposase-like protein
MLCPYCHSDVVVKNGTRRLSDGQVLQAYRCRGCGRQFDDRSGTPMARLRTPSSVVEYALNSRSEGMGIRATGRVYGKSHATMMRWEKRLARQGEAWSPSAPEGSDLTLEGDELYTRVGENLPPL